MGDVGEELNILVSTKYYKLLYWSHFKYVVSKFIVYVKQCVVNNDFVSAVLLWWNMFVMQVMNSDF
jgi:hypothetical protein